MRIYCLILALLLAVGVAMATSRRGFVAPQSGAAAACSKGQTTNQWSLLIEGFTSGYDSNQWVEVGATTNITEGADSSALTSAKPPGACDTAWRIVDSNDAATTRARIAVGSITNNSVIVLGFNLYIAEGPDTMGEAYQIYGFTAATAASSVRGINLQNNGGGQLQLQAKGAVDSTAINVSAGQWYTVILQLDPIAGADGSTFSVYSGGSQVGTDAFTRTDSDIVYLHIGLVLGTAVGEEADLYFDQITAYVE